MNNSEIENKLQQMTKQEITALIIEWIESGVLDRAIITDYFIKNNITAEQSELLNKIKAGVQLTDDEHKKITEITAKSIKVCSALKSNNVLLREIVNYKIDYYFDLCWKVYPKKVGKELGKKSFIKLVGELRVNELNEYCKYVYNRIIKYSEYISRTNTDTQYILHFSTFCNTKKYL